MRIPPGMVVNWRDMCDARGGIIEKRSEPQRIVSRRYEGMNGLR
jgi:hypothetical protein